MSSGPRNHPKMMISGPRKLVNWEGLRRVISMEEWPQRTRGSRRSRSARAQGRYATPRGYAPLESTAMVAFGNHCEPSLEPTAWENSEGKFRATSVFSIFLPNFFPKQVKSLQFPVSSS